VYVDNAPPNVTKTIGQPFINHSGDYYITNETEIWLNVTENRSYDVGGWTLHWKIWNATTHAVLKYNDTQQNASLTINESCTHILGYYVNDSLGNRWPSSGYHNETFYVDTTPPVSTISFGSPNCINDSKEWINFSTLIHINAADAGCHGGVGNYTIYYRIWNETDGWGSWNNSTLNASENLTINILEECKHYIEYYAVDGLGNNESESAFGYVNNKTIYVDNTPPISSVVPIIPYEQNHVPFYINVTANDAGCSGGCGIKYVELWYRNSSDNSTWSSWMLYGIDYSEPYQWLFYAPNGSQYYEFSSIAADNLGNKETIPPGTADAMCHVTAEPPVTTKTVGTPKHGPNDEWVSSNTYFTFTVDDPDGNNSNATVYYRVWYNGNWVWDWTVYGSPFTLPGGDCTHYIEYYAVDEDGNIEAVHNQTHYVDNTSPEINVNVGNPNEQVTENVYYVTTSTSITIYASDVGCSGGVGLDTLKYRIKVGTGSWGSWISISSGGSITFGETCEHQLQIEAKDHLGNTNTTTLTFYVDDTPPEIPVIVHEPSEADGSNYYVTTSTSITIYANDVGCNGGVGLDTLRYRIWYNGAWGSWISISSGGSITFGETCEHQLQIEAKDHLGNTNTTTLTFYVDDTPPDIQVTVGNPNDQISSSVYYVTTSTLIEISAADAGCHGGVGVHTWAYRIWYNGIWSSWAPYSTPFTFNETCQHYLEVNATDLLGNNRTENITFYVDDTPPDTSDSEVITGHSYDNGLWITTSTDISFKLTPDPDKGCNGGVGLDKIKYRIWYDSNDDGSFADETPSSWKDYTPGSTFNIPETCYHKIEWYGIDKLGNEETPHNEQIHYVDDTPPDTSDILKITGYNYTDGVNTWVTTSTSFFFDLSSDPDKGCNGGVGLYRIKYRIWKDLDNDGFGDESTPSWHYRTTSSPFTIEEECHHKIEWYGIDELGNEESYNSREFYADDTPPATNIYFNPPEYNNFITSNTSITLDATDLFETLPGPVDNWMSGSGNIIGISPTEQTVFHNQEFIVDIKVKPSQPIAGAQFDLTFDPALLMAEKVTYGGIFGSNYYFQNGTIDNVAGRITGIAGIMIGDETLSDGTLAKITFKAKDAAGLSSLNLSGVIMANMGGVELGSIVTNNGTVNIKVSCGTGSYTIYYRIWNMSNGWDSWQHGNENENVVFNIGDECQHYIEYYSVDAVGNVENINNKTVYVDNTPPFTVLSYGEPHQYTEGRHYIDYDTPIYLNSSDGGYCAVGSYMIFYRIWNNYAGWSDWMWGSDSTDVSFTLENLGYTNGCKYYVEYYAVDDLDNAEEKRNDTFYVDEENPIATLIYPNGGELLSKEVTIQWTATDACDPSLSIDIYYSDDGGNNWHPVAEGLPNTGSYSWDTSLLNYGTNYLLKIIAVDDVDNEGEDISDSTFAIDNTPPEIENLSAMPNPQEIYGLVNISADITDASGVADVYLNITYPDGSSENFSIISNYTINSYYCNKTFSQLGNHYCYIWAVDSAGNTNISSVYQFDILDTTPPEITNVVAMPVQQETGHNVNISATVTDNVGVADVFLNITYPDGTHHNFSIKQNVTGNTYYCGQSYGPVGTYYFYIWTIDTSGNSNLSDLHTFSIIITHIDISPNTQFHYAGENITVDITIFPSQPVAGVQFDLTFDPTLLTAKEVTYGDIFGSSNYYFQNGTIDNENGSIKNVAGIITGGSSVSSSGVLARIMFTASNETGISYLNLSEVIIGDSSGGEIVPIQINNGSISVGIDNTPPIVVKEIGDPKYNDGEYISNHTYVTLNAYDAGAYASGVKEIHYIVGYPNGTNKEFVVSGDVAQFTFAEEGEHTLEFWAVDNLDNEGNHTIQTHYVDDTGPVTIKELGEPNYSDGKYVTTDSTITITSSDSGAGVKEIHYIVGYPNGTNKEFVVSGDVAQFTFAEEGEHTLEFWAVDNLDNEGNHTIQTHYVDGTPPQSNVDYIYPYAQDAPILITVSASSDEGGCGIQYVELWYRYSLDNLTWSSWILYGMSYMTPYDYTFNTENSGYYQFYSVATDNLGNREPSPVQPDAIAYLSANITHTFHLHQGWNLITIPVQNNFTAETLGQNISYCDAIVKWDVVSQDYITHPVGTAIADFDIEDGIGYFVHVSESTTFSITGKIVSNISLTLQPGWNLLGWSNTETISAELFGETISGCDTVMEWDSLMQDYIPHPMATNVNNFDVNMGMGLFIHTDQASIWYGGLD